MIGHITILIKKRNELLAVFRKAMLDKHHLYLNLVFRLLWSSTFALILTSCFSAAKTFQGFQEKSSDVESIVFLHEAMILRDIQGKRHFIHEQENIRSLECIHEAVKNIVISKGYEVSKQSIWSIGLTEKPGTPLLVFTGSKGEWPGFFSDEKLVQEASPVAVKRFGFDEEAIPVAGSLHRHLKSESELIREMKGTFYSSYTKKLNLPQNSALLITQSYGEQIFTGKKIVEWTIAILGGLVSGSGRGADIIQHDTTTHFLFIVHSDTGELLWADYYDEIGGNRSEYALEHGLRKLLDELPNHEPN